jgi:HK97 family phage major capsid protein
MPNTIMVNPQTKSKMVLLKDSLGQYIFPRWADPSTANAAGMKIIDTPAITVDNFLAGDFSVINVLIREQVSIQIGLDGNDFTNNIKTILMEQRLVQFISANDTPVLVTGTFTAAKAALENPS